MSKKSVVPEQKNRLLLRGVEAFAQGTLDGGIQQFFGPRLDSLRALYSTIDESLVPQKGSLVFGESAEAAIHMAFGAAAGGGKVLSAFDSPGFSRVQEGLSYFAAAELPIVLLNIMRAGPGTGNVSPGQSDYIAACSGGGHGDYRSIVLAPGSVQDFYDMGRWAVELTNKYQTPAIILADAAIAQLMEPVALNTTDNKNSSKSGKSNRAPKATSTAQRSINGCKDGSREHLTTLQMNETELEIKNYKLFEKYEAICNDFSQGEPLAKSYSTIGSEKCDLLIVSYGILSRVARTAIEKAKKRGYSVSHFNIKTLWPFPDRQLAKFSRSAKQILVPELSMGQLVDDVRRSVTKPERVHLYARSGGRIPSPFELLNTIKSILDEK